MSTAPNERACEGGGLPKGRGAGLSDGHALSCRIHSHLLAWSHTWFREHTESELFSACTPTTQNRGTITEGQLTDIIWDYLGGQIITRGLLGTFSTRTSGSWVEQMLNYLT